jgi:hypothetical protein
MTAMIQFQPSVGSKSNVDRRSFMNLDWIAGFFDGEGSVSIQIQRKRDSRFGYRFTPRVSIAQKKRDVLDEIQKSLKMGHVYPSPPAGAGSSTWRMEVCNREQLVKFCSLFLNRILLKRRQLVLLSSAISLLQDREAKILSKQLVIRLVEIAQQIRVLNDHKRSPHTDLTEVRRRLIR